MGPEILASVVFIAILFYMVFFLCVVIFIQPNHKFPVKIKLDIPRYWQYCPPPPPEYYLRKEMMFINESVDECALPQNNSNHTV